MNKPAVISVAVATVMSISGCGDSRPEFTVINDDNVVEFVVANIDRAGSAEVVNSDLDLTVMGNTAPYFQHKPNAALPEPYAYILVLCPDSGASVKVEARLKNTSPVMFGIGQSEGDPAFKLMTNSCTVGE